MARAVATADVAGEAGARAAEERFPAPAGERGGGLPGCASLGTLRARSSIPRRGAARKLARGVARLSRVRKADGPSQPLRAAAAAGGEPREGAERGGRGRQRRRAVRGALEATHARTKLGRQGTAEGCGLRCECGCTGNKVAGENRRFPTFGLRESTRTGPYVRRPQKHALRRYHIAAPAS